MPRMARPAEKAARPISLMEPKENMMINGERNSVRWPLLLFELDDAREHLEALVDQMNEKGEIDEAEFSTHLGHVYSHLNRAWNSRNRETMQTEEEFKAESEFPKDIRPI